MFQLKVSLKINLSNKGPLNNKQMLLLFYLYAAGVPPQGSKVRVSKSSMWMIVEDVRVRSASLSLNWGRKVSDVAANDPLSLLYVLCAWTDWYSPPFTKTNATSVLVFKAVGPAQGEEAHKPGLGLFRCCRDGSRTDVICFLYLLEVIVIGFQDKSLFPVCSIRLHFWRS